MTSNKTEAFVLMLNTESFAKNFIKILYFLFQNKSYILTRKCAIKIIRPLVNNQPSTAALPCCETYFKIIICSWIFLMWILLLQISGAVSAVELIALQVLCSQNLLS